MSPQFIFRALFYFLATFLIITCTYYTKSEEMGRENVTFLQANEADE